MLGIELSNRDEMWGKNVILLSCNYKFFTASKFEGNEPIRISIIIISSSVNLSRKIVNNIPGYKQL